MKASCYAVKKYSSHRCIPVSIDQALVRMLEAEKAAAAAAELMAAEQEAAEMVLAVADAAANPIHADVPEGVEPFTLYTVLPGAKSTTRTQFTRSNTKCDACELEESATRIFERCERCNIVYHRSCLEPQGSYVFLCDYPQCREEWDALIADPELELPNDV